MTNNIPLNSETISASTLALMIDMPPSKASKYISLLTDDDLSSYREAVESKTASLESFVKQSQEDTEAGKDLKTLGASTQTELLACYGVLKKIDALFEKRERDSERARNKGRSKKSILEQVNEKLMKGGSSVKY